MMNIRANRKARKYSLKEQIGRVFWNVLRPLFRFSPRPAFFWRSFLLRLCGAQIGKHVHVYPDVRIEMPWQLGIGDWSAIGEGARIYSLGQVTIGSQVTISPYAYLCAGTHDYADPELPLQRRPITIEDAAWICADAFVGPGVTIGEGAVCGARAVVVKDVPAWTVVAGNPAREIKKRELSA